MSITRTEKRALLLRALALLASGSVLGCAADAGLSVVDATAMVGADGPTADLGIEAVRPDLDRTDLRRQPLDVSFELAWSGVTLGPRGSTAGRPVAADFDGDGTVDLVDANLTLFRGHGDGTFTPERVIGTVPVPIDAPRWLMTGDFDGDGRADLATTQRMRETIVVALQKGGGVFTPFIEYAVRGGPADIALGDFDQDGDVDIAVSILGHGEIGKSVDVLANDGKGRFGPPAVFPVPPHPWTLLSADFDGDGRLDLALSVGLANDSVGILLNAGKAAFGQPVLYEGSPNLVGYPVAGDFDGDGRIDLMWGVPGGHTLCTLLGRGDGNFAPPLPSEVGVRQYVSVTVADVDLDGVLDAVVPAPLVVLSGLGNGAFGAPKPVAGDLGAHTEAAVVVMDLNADGKPDIITTADNAVYALLNRSR